MRNLGAVEAANEIRNDVFNMPGIDPEQQHQVRFVQSVCSQLGLDHSPDNMHKVATVLHKHDIGLHVGHEFPKVAYREYDRASKVVDDEVEEREWIDQPPPEPALPPGPVIEEPIQGSDYKDIRSQVPSDPKTMEHPAGRASDAQTNAAASGGMMGTAHDDGKAAHDHNPGSVEDPADEDSDEVVFDDPEPPAPEPVKPSRKRPT